MNLQEIKQAIDQGKNVYWCGPGYKVIQDNAGEYLIKCTSNNHCIGLTWQDNVTMNGKESDFFTT